MQLSEITEVLCALCPGPPSRDVSWNHHHQESGLHQHPAAPGPRPGPSKPHLRPAPRFSRGWEAEEGAMACTVIVGRRDG